MDEIVALVLLALVVLSFFVAMPIVAFVSARRARSRVNELQIEFEDQQDKLRYLYEQNQKLKSSLQRLEAGVVPEQSTPEAEPPTAPALPAQTESEAVQQTPAAPAADAQPPAAEPIAARSESKAEAPATPPPPKPPEKPKAPAVPLEQRLATWFTRAGAAALLLGVLYFFKYAVDNDWIGPAGRVLIGVVAGVGLVAFAEVFRSRVQKAYQHVLVGVGLSLLIISGWAAGALYHLVATPIAFGGNALVLFAGTALAFRHRAQAVLAVVLIAGFANPVVLSTGEDRPFALFLYLALLTAGALWVSARRGFRFTTALSILGVLVLGAGWYEKFFEVHDIRKYGADVPIEEATGAYFKLSTRIVPLAFTALFTGLWIAAAELGRQRQERRGITLTVLLTALTFAHCSATALLHDKPLALGAAMCVIAIGSVASARWFGAVHLLIIPLLTAFALLVGVGSEARGREQDILLALLGVLTAIYGATFVLYARREAAFRPVDVARIAVVVACLVGTVGVWLLPAGRSVLAAAIGTVALSVFAWVTVRGRTPPWTAASVGFAMAFLATCAVRELSIPAKALGDVLPAWSPAIVALGFLASLVHLWAADRSGQTSSTKEEGILGLLTTAFSVLGFAGVALLATHPSAETLRAIWIAIAAALALASSHLCQLRPGRSEWSAVMAALALGLSAAAVGFGLSGAPLTVLWAILMAVAAAIYARRPVPTWAVTLGLFGCVVVIRLASFDLELPSKALSEFWASGGMSGQLRPAVLFNPRAYALIGTGLAGLVGGWRLALNHKTRVPAALLLAFGWTCLLVVTVLEVRNGMRTYPELPNTFIPSDELYAFMDLVRMAHAETQAAREVATTLVLGLFAGLLLVIGFALKDPFHRWLGLLVFFLTLGKLVGYDVWQLPRLYQVVVLTGVGVLLLAAGFLYARLKALFIKGSVAVLLLGALSSTAQAQNSAPKVEAWKFSHRFEVQGVKGSHDHILELSNEVVMHSASRNMLDDLRFADDKGHAVPHVVRPKEALRPANWRDTRMFDSGELPGGNASRATFEILDRRDHCEIELALSGPTPFQRRSRIEVKQEEQGEYVTVAEGGLVFSINGQNRQHRIRYRRSRARWVRVTLLEDANSRRSNKIRSGKVACRSPKSAPPRAEHPLEIIERGPGEQQGTSQIIVDVGRTGVPIDRLDLEFEDKEFVRPVSIEASTHRQVWPQLRRSMVWRTVSSTGTPDGLLHLKFKAAKKRYFRLVFEDGDNAALVVTKVRGSTGVWQTLVRPARPGPIMGYVGGKGVYAPNYDLDDILRRKDAFSGPKLHAGPVEENPLLGKKPPDRPPPWTEQHRGIIGGVVAALALLIGAWAFVVVRREDPEEEAARADEGSDETKPPSDS